MTNDLLIRKDRHGYCVVFRNYHGYSNEDIKQIFQHFGQVVGITARGDEKGYRFVRYASFDEAENAVQGLTDHPTIKLCFHRYRDNEAKRLEKQNNKNKRESMDATGLKKPSIKVWDHEINVHDFETSSQLSSSASYPGNLMYSPSMKNLGSQNSQESDHKGDWKQNKTEPYFNNLEHLEKNLQSSSISDLPPLVRNFGQGSQQQVSINAVDVVVGNIHPLFSEAYILHLLEKHSPLAISFMDYIPNTNRRFCYVYFHKREDAEEVERLYDNSNLMGMRLVVRQPHKLEVEACNQVNNKLFAV